MDALAGIERRIFTVDFLGRPIANFNNIKHLTCPFPDSRLAKVIWPNTVLPLYAARARLDLVHATTHYGTFVPSRYRNVITIHDVTPLLFPETHDRMQVYYHRHILPHVLKRVDAVITISEQSKQDILRCYGICESKVHVIYHGVDGRFSPEASTDTEFIRGLPSRYILNIGTIEARKNITRLIEAFALAREKGLPQTLLIGGVKGWRISDIEGIVERYALEGAVQFLGYVEENDIPPLYAKADFFIYPSIYEGFGLPILEAMASGTPVITSNRSSMLEVAGDAALFINPLDTAELAGKMLELAESADLRADLRCRGINWAARFSWEKTARETLAIYERTV